jgi:hypothetical protein
MDYMTMMEKNKLKRLSKPISIFDIETNIDYLQMKKKFYQDCQKYLEEEVESKNQLEQVERFIRTIWKGDIINDIH